MAEAEGEGAPAAEVAPEPAGPVASAELLEACMLGRAAKLNTYFAKRPDEKEMINELKSSKNGWSPLQVAAGYGKAEAVAALLELGNKADLVDKLGMTVVHIAGGNAEKEVLPTILRDASGVAAIDVQDEDGCTALHYAAYANLKDNVISLLRAGANKDLQDAEGRTAQKVAEEQKNKECIDVLVNGPPPEDAPEEGGAEGA